MASVVLARRGARVTALEVSPLYLQEALLRAACNGLGGRITAVHGSGEQLPFADAVFDCVWGNAILHHLDLSRAGLEIHRVLRPGGRAIFCEPWGGNPVLEWARRRLPYPEKSRSVAEQPLRQRDLKFLAAVFPNLTVAPFQLLGMTRRLWPQSPFLGAFDRMDRALFRHWRGLRGWCRYIVLCLTR
jgi:SAM-dependent methyltransferase